MMRDHRERQSPRVLTEGGRERIRLPENPLMSLADSVVYLEGEACPNLSEAMR